MAKLVRDRIPERIIAKGENPRFYVATPDQYARALVEKLVEEAHEFKENPTLEELADVETVVRAIAEFYEWNLPEAVTLKYLTHGGFKQRYILE